jgi:hypothetical protein
VKKILHQAIQESKALKEGLEWLVSECEDEESKTEETVWTASLYPVNEVVVGLQDGARDLAHPHRR